ncbi:FAD-dependent monooxygenase [Actinocatenispora sera]|uniref:FAD-dependent monooxygenase n=1 Tax=Actinocatenispora sera TaxID=390989 RepID=UPI0004C353FE|nr:FAD-dependent monooxygenase [Actinocatenispora sera]
MTGTPSYEVVVAGGGPTGLLLANELALAGVSTVVVERLAARTGQSKALNLQPRSAQILDLRGMLEPIRKRAIDELPAGHFAGIELDYAPWGEHQIGIPQARVEEYLERRLTERGVPVRRGSAVVAVDAGPDEVVVRTEAPTGGDRIDTADDTGGTELHCRYLVACDGGRSTVRSLLGLRFPGRDARMSAVVADVTLTEPDGEPAAGSWRLPRFDRPDGTVAEVLPLTDGVYRAVVAGPEQQTLPREAPVTLDELRRALPAVATIRWASRFTDASRQLERYRHGRVLFAGDAAHIHSPTGGQGLNLGLQDAFNLGWKIAAALRGNTTVLDTYHAERHPVAARVLASTRAQGVLLVPDPDVMALRELVTELIALPAANRYLAGLVSGLELRYELPGGHPLLGRALPDLDPTLLHAGRAVVLEAGERARYPGDQVPGYGWGDEALLVRPDGRVGWVDDGYEPLADALTRWT